MYWEFGCILPKKTKQPITINETLHGSKRWKDKYSDDNVVLETKRSISTFFFLCFVKLSKKKTSFFN